VRNLIGLVIALEVACVCLTGCGPTVRGPAVVVEGDGPRELVIGGKTVDPATHAVVLPELQTPQELAAAWASSRPSRR